MACSAFLRKKGLPYPRTCAEHGLGPCPSSAKPMTKFDMIEAAGKTLQWALRDDMQNCSSEDRPELDYDHLEGIVLLMKSSDDLGKIGRLLGWLQAAVCANPGTFRLEDAKEINRSF